jgi:phosphoribosylformimino-5-aminoimidazole carboxamide ribotide isomerase
VIVIPAIDLREGACVQLVGGSYEAERIRIERPVEVARGWVHAGFQRLHVVDLDAATERGNNSGIVREILGDATVPVQVAGGIRDTEMVERHLVDGAEWVVIGTRALEDPGWLEDICRSHPGRVIVAADVRGRRVVTHGWMRSVPRGVVEFAEEFSSLDLGGVLVTAVHLEGRMRGTDLPLMERVVEATHIPVIASGGISGLADLRALDERGVAAAVVGMALYTGAIEPGAVLEEFNQ